MTMATALRRPLSVLVVDDYPDAANSLRTLLRLSGHLAEAAYDGEEALRSVQAHEPDVLLIDLAMPLMSGYTLLKLLDSVFIRRPLLVAVTGYGMAADRRHCLEAGFDYHLLKPIDFDDLNALLQERAKVMFLLQEEDGGR